MTNGIKYITQGEQIS